MYPLNCGSDWRKPSSLLELYVLLDSLLAELANLVHIFKPKLLTNSLQLIILLNTLVDGFDGILFHCQDAGVDEQIHVLLGLLVDFIPNEVWPSKEWGLREDRPHNSGLAV